MGRDKAMIGWPDDPWAGRVVAAVRASGIADVLIVGGDARLDTVAPLVPDDLPGQGPAAAAATLIRWRPGRSVLLCACDLPFLTAGALAPVVAAVGRGAPAAVPELDGVAAWSVVALGPAAAFELATAVQRGTRSLHGCLDALAERIPAADPGPLRDLDAPEDGGG